MWLKHAQIFIIIIIIKLPDQAIASTPDLVNTVLVGYRLSQPPARP
jgi:hypothetical protein